MDRRTLLALLLTAVVIVATPLIFPAPRQPRPSVSDTARPPRDTMRPAPAIPATTQPTVSEPPRQSEAPLPTAARVETTTVQTTHAIYRIVSPGATPASVTLPEYRSLLPGQPAATAVNLLESGDRLFRLTLASDVDTIALDTLAFRAAPLRREGSTIVQSF